MRINIPAEHLSREEARRVIRAIHPTREEAFERVKRWLEMNKAASGDEAITNLRADEIVGLVLDV